MAKIPARVSDRIAKGIKRFQPILATAKARDDGEADTAMIVTDMLAEVFGYDKFSEVTAEYSIRGTYCDLATKIEGALQSLIEVKAIGLELKDNHVRQAVDYAANQGIDWVVLTNGICWRVYKVTFTKPIDHELVVEINVCELDGKRQADIESLYLLCKEGWIKSVLGDFHTQRQALNRFSLGAMVLSDPVLIVIRRELRRASPDVRIEVEQIRDVLSSEVIKRDVMEGEKAEEAQKKISRAASKALRARASKNQAPTESVRETPAKPPAPPSAAPPTSHPTSKPQTR